MPSHEPAPRCAVVIPCYNYGRYLGEAIESVLRQSYQEIEIVVVDDGSTDDTARVIEGYPHVRYIHQSNRGLSAARNTGWQATTAEYICFLDADDRLLPDALRIGVAHLEQCSACAFVSGRYNVISADGSFRSAGLYTPVSSDQYAALLKSNYIGMHATVLFRRTALAAVSGFDETLHACEDYDIYLRIARCFPVLQHDSVIAEYRIHDCNMSSNARLMLRAAQRTLKRQEAHAALDPAHARALREGWRKINCYYGGRIGKELTAALRQRNMREAALRIGMLARHYPQGIAQAIWRLNLPGAIIGRLRQNSAQGRPAIGAVRLGDLQRQSPISKEFGYDRGTPVDRFYIERFLDAHRNDIRGRVLEIGDDSYTRRFGDGRVTASDVLHISEGNPHATIVGDLANAEHIPADRFDCIILTQTLHLIYDMPAAMRTLRRILAPGGVLLGTVPGITPLSRDQWSDTWYWSLTALAVRRLCTEVFAPEDVDIHVHGNVLSATAFLYGLAAEELQPADLAYHDPRFPVTVTFRVKKRGPA